MATRKQRRRREKTFRHEYGFVVSDEEGNEIELAGAELRAKKASSTKPAAKGKPAAKPAGRSRREPRVPDVPSWRRSARRAAIWSPATIVLAYIVFRSAAVGVRIGIGLAYAVAFIPMTYWIDGFVYRRYQKRQLDSSGRPGKTR